MGMESADELMVTFELNRTIDHSLLIYILTQLSTYMSFTWGMEKVYDISNIARSDRWYKLAHGETNHVDYM